jgi:hypothetical protein
MVSPPHAATLDKEHLLEISSLKYIRNLGAGGIL